MVRRNPADVAAPDLCGVGVPSTMRAGGYADAARYSADVTTP